MATMNRVFLMGNLIKNPVMQSLKSGPKVANIRLAVTGSYKNKDGKDVETVSNFDVIALADLAERCGKDLSKGSLVMVEGTLQTREWEKDGQKRRSIFVRASRMEFLSKA